MSTQGARLSGLRGGDDVGQTRDSWGAAAFRAHGPAVARVCMALLGDGADVERVLEQVARESGAAGGSGPGDDAGALERLLGLARVACATRLSKLPLASAGRTAPGAGPGAEAAPAALARAAFGRLRPTEREAVVLVVVGGLDAPAVARVCGIDLDTARGRIARGLTQLTKEKRA